MSYFWIHMRTVFCIFVRVLFSIEQGASDAEDELRLMLTIIRQPPFIEQLLFVRLCTRYFFF